MHVTFEDVNEAFQFFCNLPQSEWVRQESRNGPVLRLPGPHIVTYKNPRKRVLFNPARDCNPFFHLFESVWMLAGSNELLPVKNMVKNMANFSDNGETLNGAYGYRWRKYFGYDQLDWISDELIENRDSRRCVLQMWDGGRTVEEFDWKVKGDPIALDCSGDLYLATHGCKDVPCNTACTFEIEDGRLNMSVFNRSNDIVWGMFGANVVHFSVLQEYMAARIGCEIGVYNQISTNTHAYLKTWKPEEWATHHLYENTDIYPWPLPRIEFITSLDYVEFDAACRDIVSYMRNLNPYASTESPLLNLKFPILQTTKVACKAYKHYLEGNLKEARQVVDLHMLECDWKTACLCWLERRIAKRETSSTN